MHSALEAGDAHWTPPLASFPEISFLAGRSRPSMSLYGVDYCAEHVTGGRCTSRRMRCASQNSIVDWQLQNHRDYVDSRFGWMKEGQFRTADSVRETLRSPCEFIPTSVLLYSY